MFIQRILREGLWRISLEFRLIEILLNILFDKWMSTSVIQSIVKLTLGGLLVSLIVILFE